MGNHIMPSAFNKFLSTVFSSAFLFSVLGTGTYISLPFVAGKMDKTPKGVPIKTDPNARYDRPAKPSTEQHASTPPVTEATGKASVAQADTPSVSHGGMTH